MKRVTGVFILIIMLYMIHAISAMGENLSGNAFLSEADIQKIKKTGIALVIPTYIPEGFTLNKVDVKFDKRFGNSYSIEYQKASKVTFTVAACCGGIGDYPISNITYPFKNPVFGKGNIEWQAADSANPQYCLSTWLRGKKEFPVYHVFSYSIDPKEAVRIAESLRYMDSSSQASGESRGKVDISGTWRSSTGATINISPYGEAERFQIKAYSMKGDYTVYEAEWQKGFRQQFTYRTTSGDRVWGVVDPGGKEINLANDKGDWHALWTRE